VLAHPWLKKLDPALILDKKVEAPLKPYFQSDDPLDTSNFFKCFTREEVKDTVVPIE